MNNVEPDAWEAMSEREQAAYVRSKEAPYLAANGHTMVMHPKYPNGRRPLYSSAWTVCVDDCGACAAGEPLPDW